MKRVVSIVSPKPLPKNKLSPQKNGERNSYYDELVATLEKLSEQLSAIDAEVKKQEKFEAFHNPVIKLSKTVADAFQLVGDVNAPYITRVKTSHDEMKDLVKEFEGTANATHELKSVIFEYTPKIAALKVKLLQRESLLVEYLKWKNVIVTYLAKNSPTRDQKMTEAEQKCITFRDMLEHTEKMLIEELLLLISQCFTDIQSAYGAYLSGNAELMDKLSAKYSDLTTHQTEIVTQIFPPSATSTLSNRSLRASISIDDVTTYHSGLSRSEIIPVSADDMITSPPTSPSPITRAMHLQKHTRKRSDGDIVLIRVKSEDKAAAPTSIRAALSLPNSPDVGRLAIFDSKLTEREWALITTHASEMVLNKDESVAVHETRHILYRILTGSIRVDADPGGKVITLSRMELGDIFGNVSDTREKEENPIAKYFSDVDNCRVQIIERTFTRKLFKLEPMIALKFYKHLATCLSHRLKSLPSSVHLGDKKKEGIFRFNNSAKQGMKYLKEQEVIDSPESAAMFLKNNTLDKVRIGEYLGDRDEYNKKVLEIYTKEFEFKEMSIDLAMRSFLSHFRLPGEAQAIDRVMAAFSNKYFDDNPAKFAERDAVYLLAFSIIMLATDLHNPNVKNKMTKIDWLKNNRGNNGGQDYDKDELLELYDRIAQEAFKLKEEPSERVSTDGEISTKDQKDADFRRRFGFGDDEMVLQVYACTYKRTGVLYISQKHICFYAKVFGMKDKTTVTFSAITSLEKGKSNPPSILVVEGSKRRSLPVQLAFRSLEERDDAFNISRKIWNKGRRPSVLVDSSSKVNFLKSVSSHKEKDTSHVTGNCDHVDEGLPDDEDWNMLLTRATYVQFPKGTVIVEEGVPSQKIYQIMKGIVRIEKKTTVVAAAQEPPGGGDLTRPQTPPQSLIKSPSNRSDNSPEKKRVFSFFRRFDLDCDGSINLAEFENLLSELGEDQSQANIMFPKIDVNSDGSISFDEFYDWWTCSADDEEGDMTELMKKLKRSYFKRFLNNLAQSSGSLSGMIPTRILGKMEVGDVFGEMSCLEGGSASASVIAETDVDVYIMEGHTLHILFEWKPILGAKFFNYLATLMEKRLLSRQKRLVSDVQQAKQN